MALSDNELSAEDLTATQSNWIQYSKQHRNNLPPGSVTGFEWKDYCPKAFRLIQELENIDNDNYMKLVCSDETIRKVSSTLRLGNMFFLSKDNRFAIKTLRKSEVKVLIQMLPSYYSHLKKFRNTVLNKLYGVHLLKPVGGVKVYFVVVANIFKSDLLMHRCYDLKGSLQGRKVEKMRYREKTLHKESDLDFFFYLEPLIRDRLLKQIKHDCAFLEAEGIMDYSLLLGLHVKGSPQGLLNRGNTFSPNSSHLGSVDSRCSDNNMRISNDLLHQSDLSSQRSSIPSFRDSIDSRSSTTELSFGDQWLQNNSHFYTFGEEMSARGIRVSRNGTASLLSRQNSRARECHDVLLYFGIVDFFQNYNVVKRIEHAYKSLQFDRKMIAAINPKAYSSRFQDFLSDIFKADDSLL
ncbi:phosphatidylinositol 4-phosphate 5-kinase 10-like [Durio zibethinus]|uniref:1-phosphatidylinositol-4-phosphate 5-kinase n=1 Tax=Durio zibethinus TaxID=66656 RepID=A0A6P6AXS3_DURZI|nr:phosphatidylinositol 4-phosphate 5-kinase 10-like [Durio zibethinus]